MLNPPTGNAPAGASDKQPLPSGGAKNDDAKPESPAANNGVFHGLWIRNRRWIEIVIILGTIGGFFLYSKSWLESSIETSVRKALTDDVALRKIAAESQPWLLFNENGGIIADSGGLAYIEKVVIEARGESLPVKILVKPKRLLQQAPLLSTVDGLLLEYTADRKEGLDWEYSITNYVSMKLNPDVKTCRFRLEILR